MKKLLARVPNWNLFRGTNSRRLGLRQWSMSAIEALEDRALLAAFSVQQAAVQQVGGAATPLVAYGSNWKYLDNGTDQGTAWRAAGFNDAAWASGPSKLGYGDANNATTVGFGPSSTNKYVTTYFRQSFNIANPGSISTLDLGVVRDDGVAVYLNGVEIVRNNLAAGALFNTLAPSPAIDAANETTPQTSSVSVASLPVGTLVAGTNVLSAEIHQQAVGSSDIGFNFQMTSSGSSLEVVVDFNQAFNASTLAASDLLIDGAATASSVTIVDADTAKFQLAALAAGSHTISLPVGSVLATDTTPLDAFSQSVTVAATPQYSFNHNPRLQLGNAPLVGYAGSSTDQMEVLWQTISAGAGTQDSFSVEYRLAGSTGAWLATPATSSINTGIGGRINHFTTMTGLSYATQYQYRVRHRQADVIVKEFTDTFRTRNPAGDASTFSFATYGDSASLSAIANFRSVQNQINALDPRFVVLLGDNVYETGSHTESDARFSPSLNPEAADWMASHVDYVGYGNHDIGTASGQPSEDNFSVPVQVAGVNAPAAPPVTEEPEHNYSFDYGNIHFVTFDTNSLSNATRLDALLNYVEADLAASTATWKIVYGHHPVGGSPDKTESPSDNYYQQVVPRLKAAGVSLFLAGHSHTYHWSYPLISQSGGAATFVNDTDKNYEDGAGLVQLVSGLGGRELRPGTFTQFPFVAAGYSSQTATPSEYGFTQIDVTPTQLVVKYIAADNGAVLDQFFITTPGGANLPPVAVNDSATTNEDTAVTVSVLTNDSDPENNTLTVQSVTQGAKGAVTNNGNGTVTYSPSANANGSDSFSYTISDGNGGTATATVSLTINPINDLPIAVNDSASTNPSTAVTISVLANDSDVDGNTLTVQSVTQGAQGSVTNNGNGTVTYTANANASGNDAFNYTISDGNGGTATATVNVFVGQSVVFQQGVSGYVGTVDTFLQQDAAFVNANNSAAVSLNVDSDDPATTGFDVQSLLRFDNLFGNGAGQIPTNATLQSATLQLQVTNLGNSINVHRMLSNWSASNSWATFTDGVQANGVEAVAAADVSTGAVALGSLSINVLSSLQAWLAAPASNLGWVLLPTGSDGVDFDSAEGTTKPKLTVTYVPASNTAPTISDIANQSTNEDTATAALAFTIDDAETAAASLTVSATSSNTTLVPNANLVLGGSGASRTLIATPAANLSGTTTITVSVTDGNGATATDTFTLTVNALNDLPTVSDIANQMTIEDVPTGALAFTIGDVETAAASLTVSATSSDTTLIPNANLVLGGSGASRTLTVTPAANQSGTATITVTITDANSGIATDTFTLAVNAINDLPTISDIAHQTTNANTATGALAFTIGDVETAAASLTVTATSSNTTLIPNANLVLGGSGASRTLTATPAADQSGTATITVTVTDASNATATDTFVLTVLANSKFFVVDSGLDDTFQYSASGVLTLNHNLAATNLNPQGVVTSLDGSTVWVLDGNKTVFVYNATGTLLGSWTTATPRTPTGITTNGTDLWIVDKGNDRVYFYAGAAARRSGTVAATSSFALGTGNTTPEGITTDGTTLWVVNSAATDKVFVYTIAGVLQGSWTIGNTTPTGLTIDPSGASQSIWIVDSGTDRVYEYTNARTRISGSQAAASSFALAVGNTTPTDIADPRSFSTATAPAATRPSFVASISAPPRVGEAPRNVVAAGPEERPSRPADGSLPTALINMRAAARTPDLARSPRDPVRPTTSGPMPLSLDDLFAEENWLRVLQNI